MKIETLENRKHILTNDGKLELFFVGTGGAFTKKNYQTNLLVIKGSNHILIDCGTKCTQALFEIGLPVTDIRNFLITHSHADHIGGLEEVSLMNRYFLKKKPAMVITEAYQHILWDMSLRGGCAYNEEEAGAILKFTDFWNVIHPHWLDNYPRETYQASVGGIDIKLMRTMHVPDSSFNWESSFWSCGVIIDDRILYTSDTRYDRALILDYDKKFNFEIIFHDVQFFKGGVHASIDELAEFPDNIKSKMILTHYGDNWETFRDKANELGFKGFAVPRAYYAFD
ncbi:MAG: MBL fold metallo-hydrolase [Spirochaetes bacterium]|jgi:ribonuclease BN (tRNA processing enzyme)|nr:MBL fold metallo-hydrolase [Spirochaetota bacterium]